MALKKSVVFKGIHVPDAYIKIVSTTVLPGNTQIDCAIGFFAYEGAPAFTSTSAQCAYDIDGHNPVKQGYMQIKLLDEFVNSQDC